MDLPLPASTAFSTLPALAQLTFPFAIYTPQRWPATVIFSHRGTFPDDAPAVPATVSAIAVTPHTAITASAAARVRVALTSAPIVSQPPA